MQTTTKRLSISGVSKLYGLPPRVVSRAVSRGELPAVITTTETGRERIYVSAQDASVWFNSLTNKVSGDVL